MIRIYTDTSANLTPELIEKYALGVIPFSYTVDGVEQDGADFEGKAYYDAMRAGAVVKTSMINVSEFSASFRKELAAGNDVIYVGMSGGISGSANAARIAVEELREEFPERRIEAIDTYAASLGEGIQAINAAKLLAAGVGFDGIVERILAERRNMCQYFTVDDLEYLKRGGRIGLISTVVGTVLKIKPILMGDEKGRIVLCGKVRGRRQSLLALADRYSELVQDRDDDIGIAHADDEEGVEVLLAELRKRGFKGECITVCYEPVTGAHVGPGTVALFFSGIHK